MKKIIATLGAIVAITQCSYGQWTGAPGDISYITGNVGIGTTIPSSLGGYTVLSINNASSGGLLDLQGGRSSKAYIYGNSSGLNLDGVGGLSGILFHTSSGGSVMTILPGGNVGIGTTIPSSLGGYTVLSINNASSGGLLDLQGGGSSKAYVYGNSSGLNLDGVGGSSGILFHTASGGSVMTILTGGNVGIGTANPSDPVNGNVGKIFDISGSGTTNTDIVLHTASTSNLGGGIFGVQTSNSVLGSPFIGQIGFGRTADVTSGKISSKAEIDLNNDGTTFTAMAITSVGNIGIGTTIPDAKLAVLGTIHANEVKVDLHVPGPDYVFESDYKLPNLSELKAYVDKNHHLPEIPSAAQITKDGLNLGDMNIKLLKKVEELTLYSIDQNKQLTDQKEVNQSLQEQVNILSKQLKQIQSALADKPKNEH